MSILIFIRILFCAACLIGSQVSIAQEIVDIKLFNQVAEQVIELKKTDLSESFKKLTVFERQLDELSVEQNLLYFKLLSEIQIEQNKYSSAKETTNQGLSIAKKLASPSILISELLYLKGAAYESLGDNNQAAKEYKKGLEVAESLHNKVEIAAGLINLGTNAYLADDFKRSLILLNDAYNIAGQTDDEELRGQANRALGNVYAHLQQDEQSMVYYKQSYIHFKKAGMLLTAHHSLNNIAATYILNENYQQAIDVFKKIITESDRNTPSDSLFRVYSGLASAYLKRLDSNPDKAYQYLLMAQDFLQLTEKSDYILQFYIDKANILYELGRFDYAIISIERVERILGDNPDLSLAEKQSHLNILALKARAYYKQEMFKQAYEAISSALDLTDKVYENEDNISIAQIRLKLEAEQADKKNKVLYNQKRLYDSNLTKAQSENEQQRFYLLMSALVALAFALLLVKLLQSQHRFKIASSLDSLTGSINRRSLMIKSQEAFKATKHKSKHLSLLMIDVDNFKGINEQLGHTIGDKVLAKIAFIGANMLRKSDTFGRFGGGEFMVCLPSTDAKSAKEIAERMRISINEYSWNITDFEQASISVGVASYTHEDEDLSTLIKRASEQLKKAKTLGKNKVCGDE